MSSSRNRAVETYRARLGEKGMARFEVLGRDSDRQVVRAFARQLAQGGPEAERLRAAVDVPAAQAARGGLLSALRRSPMAGAGLDLDREAVEERPVRL